MDRGPLMDWIGEVVTLIDFPQMVSKSHPTTYEMFARDVQCIRKFFVEKMKCDDDWSLLLDGDGVD